MIKKTVKRLLTYANLPSRDLKKQQVSIQ